MSDAHFAALQRNLRAAYNTHQQSKPPANPVQHIRRGSSDLTLPSTERARARTEATDRDLRDSVAGKQRIDDAGVPDDDEYEDENDEVQTRGGQGSSLSKSMHRGSFQRIRNEVNQHIAKQGTGEYMQSEEFDQRALMAELKIAPIVKANTTSLRKSMAKVANALGNATLAKSLEAGCASNSATLTGDSAVRRQSLAGTKSAPKPRVYSPAEVSLAAQNALAYGQITVEQAGRIQSELDLTGACSPESLALLRGAKPSQTNGHLLSKSECFGALSKALGAGQITGSQAIAAEACLNRDIRVADDTMAVLRKVHFDR
ncbi:hypothetical protein [Paraburkholderia tropica]|uniref:hypothetical protein n=1 Tax=Paraburkholderia tropica TaxID=92647 RepID=UPI002AB11159|nr:hypothetical protein [Paraburkholderia tropica]